MDQDSSSKSRSAANASVLRLSENTFGTLAPREALRVHGAIDLATSVPTQFPETEESLWPAIESLDAALWRLDLRSGRVDMTKAALKSFEKVFNLDPQCLEDGRFGFALHAHPDDRDRLQAMLASGLEKSFRTHFRIIDRDSEQRWINLRVSNIVKGAKSTARDSMWFFAENDTAEKGEEERQKRLLADRILSSLFGADLSKLPPEEFSSLGLMSKISEKWQPIVEEKRLRWIGPDIAPLGPASVLEGSDLLLTLMMDSLFENAIEAAMMGANENGIHPWIRFEFFEDDESVYFALSDSGSGVPLINRGMIFEPFFSTRPESSSGLGLTLARSAAEWHGGQLRLDHFSKSTRFVAQIPKRFRKPIRS